MNSDHITMLDTQVVSHNTVDTSTSVIQVIISKHNQNSVLALLALDKNCVASEELESLHGVVGKGNNGVVIVNGISHAMKSLCQYPPIIH